MQRKPGDLSKLDYIPFNPFASGDFAEKRVLKLVEWFSGPDAKYQLAKFGHAQKGKFRQFLGLKVTQ